MLRPLPIAVSFILLSFAVSAQAQTIQLVCKVKWEAECLDARLIKQKCPAVLAADANSGTLTIEGGKARTKALGIVIAYAVTKTGANELALQGEWSGPGQFVRGHGTLNSATSQLRLFMTLGKDKNDHDIVQRGLEGNCG